MKTKEDLSARRAKRSRIQLLLNWLSAVASMLAVLLSVFVSVFPGQNDADLKQKARIYVSIILSFAVLVLLMIIVITFLKQGSPSVTALKRDMLRAFSDALDKSPLNPTRNKGNSDVEYPRTEQSKPGR